MGSGTKPERRFLIIRPPYWQTWWFRSLMAAVIIGLLFLGHNYRVARLLEIERLAGAYLDRPAR